MIDNDTPEKKAARQRRAASNQATDLQVAMILLRLQSAVPRAQARYAAMGTPERHRYLNEVPRWRDAFAFLRPRTEA